MTDTEKRGPFIPQIIAIVMLLWSLYPGNPYGYYVLLRIIVCAICAFLAFSAWNIEKDKWVWILGVTAVIYNPIIPVHLTREIWSVVNVATIIVISLTFALFRKRSVPDWEGEDTGER